MQTNSQSLTLTVIALGIVGIGLGLWSLMRPETVQAPQGLRNWTEFRDTDGRFSLQYPDTYTQLPGDTGDFPIGSALVPAQSGVTVPVIATFKLDESDYGGTNLAGAWVTVAVTQNNNENACAQSFDGLTTLALTATRTQHDITWYEFADGWIAEGAAGTKFETRTFHTINNGNCYEVLLHLATTNIGNYDPGTVAAVDEGTLRAQLQSIFQTFTFTQE
ncbi:MAG: hypothetical protein QG626_365 [Patescibacteria group bacterium]|nr:hypothetical protein [Patescibacteria group bacterium]